MDQSVRILHVDDNPLDHELLKFEITSKRFQAALTYVQTEEAYLEALSRSNDFDVILSDFRMGLFDGDQALNLAKRYCPDTPFILVTGELGEEFVIERLKKGVTDYVLKDNLKRLVPVIERSLREKEEIRGRRESEGRLHAAFQSSVLGFAILRPDVTFVEVNDAFCTMLGYTRQEFINFNCASFTHPDDVQRTNDLVGELLSGKRTSLVFEKRYIRKDGKAIWVQDSVSLTYDASRKPVHLVAICQDITKRKHTETQIAQAAREQEALYLLADQLHRARSLSAVYDSALDAIIQALDCDRAAILLFDQSNVMHFVHSRGLSEAYQKAVESHSPWKPEERNPYPIPISNVELAEIGDSLKSVVRSEGIGALCFIPLVTDGKLVGKFMTYYNQPHEFSAHEIELSLTIARQLAFGIARKRAEDQLAERVQEIEAMMDVLPVGLYISYDRECKMIVGNRAAREFLKVRDDPAVNLSKSASQHEVPQHFKVLEDGRELTPEELPVQLAAHTGETIPSKELQIVYEDGEIRHELINAVPLFDKNNQPRGAIASFVDITEMKRTEKALRESEQRYRSVIDALPAAIYTTDAEGHVTMFNQAAVQFSGRVPEIGKDLWCVTWKLYWPDGRPLPHDQCPMAIALKEGRPVRGYEAIAERPDGSRIHFTPYPTPLYDSDGKMVGAVNMLVDITDRKRADEAVAHLASIVTSSTDAILSKTLDGIITSWNAGAQRLFGYTAEEMIGQPILRLIPPELQSEEEQILHRLRAGECIDHYETVRLTKYGRRIDVSLSISPVRAASGRIIGISKIVRDITELKQTQKALLHREKELTDFIENANIGLHWVTADGTIKWANKAELDLLGYRPEEYIGHNIIEFHADRDIIDDILARLRNDEELSDYHARLKAKDGSPRHVLINSSVYRENGKFIHTRCFTRDITEQKRALDALRESEERARQLMSLMPAGLYTIDSEGRITFYNPRAAELWGREPKIGIDGETFCGSYRIWLPDGSLLPHDQTPMVAAIRDGLSTRDKEVIFERPDGSRITVNVNIAPLYDTDGHLCGAVNVFQDITGRKQLELELQKRERELEERVRERTQELTAANRELESFNYTVSHDLRAPVRAIAGFSDMLLQEVNGSLSPQAKDYLNTINKSAHDMGKLVESLLVFARVKNDKLSKISVDLYQMARDVIATQLQSGEERNTHIQLNPLPTLAVDPTLMRQVFVNLLSNSLKFTRTSPAACIEIGYTSEAERVVVWVKDNGVGFDPEQREKLFEVFQRLHRADLFEGNGIGLAFCKRIIERHGGAMWAESNGEGTGATFYFSLPFAAHESKGKNGNGTVVKEMSQSEYG